MIRSHDADELFQKELTKQEIESSVHFTYRDGFRLGVGIFVGLLLGSTVVLVLVWFLSKIFH